LERVEPPCNGRPDAAMVASDSSIGRARHEPVARDVRQDSSEGCDADQDSDEARRAREARGHAGAILGDGPLQDFHGLPLRMPAPEPATSIAMAKRGNGAALDGCRNDGSDQGLPSIESP